MPRILKCDHGTASKGGVIRAPFVCSEEMPLETFLEFIVALHDLIICVQYEFTNGSRHGIFRYGSTLAIMDK